MQSEREERYLVGRLLIDNPIIETVAKDLASDEFSPAYREIVDVIFMLWVKEPKQPIDAARVGYALLSLAKNDPEAATRSKVIMTLCHECIEQARQNHVTLEQAIAIIQKRAAHERCLQVFVELEKHKDNLPNEFALAAVVRLMDLIQKGVRRPKFVELEKIQSKPPIYRLRVDMRGVQRILDDLSLKQLLERRALKEKVIEHFDQAPDFMPSNSALELLIDRLMRSMKKTAVDSARPDDLIDIKSQETKAVVSEYIDTMPRTKNIVLMREHMIYDYDGVVGVDFLDIQSYVATKMSRIGSNLISSVLLNLGFSGERISGKRLWTKKMRDEELI